MFQKYSYFDVGKTQDEINSSVIKNCTSCEIEDVENNTANSCLEPLTQSHLINDSEGNLVKNYYMRTEMERNYE
jgi:hypothetical protein